jgi:bleomycin hydrolase
MNRLLTVLVGVFVLPISLCAQESGGITPQVLNELERSCTPDAVLRAAQHAVAQVDGRKVTQSWEQIIAVDTFFTLRLDGQRITDQQQTGRCWMFSGLNILRPIAAKKLNCDDLELSQNYLYFFEKLERANLFLEAIIQTKDKPYTDRMVEFLMKTHVNDGENWLGFVELVKKYGIVPKEIMPETYSSSHSDYVVNVLGLRLKRAAVEIRHASVPDSIPLIKMTALQDVYRILAINFGLPPREFQWRYMQQDTTLTTHPTCTPREFYQEVIGGALAEYYPLYSVPTLQFNKKYEIDLDRTVYDQPNMYFVNCPLPLMKALTKQSLLDSTVVWFGCDVGRESSAEHGLMIPDLYDDASLYGMDFTLSRRDLFETYSSIPTHNMVFTGIDLEGGKVRKWLVENSWGDKKGKQGYFLMLDEWFDQYVQVVVLRKEYIPREILALFETTAEVLPPWDPMVSSARIR